MGRYIAYVIYGGREIRILSEPRDSVEQARQSATYTAEERPFVGVASDQDERFIAMQVWNQYVVNEMEKAR